METTETVKPTVGSSDGLHGLLARWAELAPAEVRMFHPEEAEHFGGEIGCITTNEHGRVHHIAGPPDDDDRAMLIQHVLRCARPRGWVMTLTTLKDGSVAELWTTIASWCGCHNPDVRESTRDGEEPDDARIAVAAYVRALERAV